MRSGKARRKSLRKKSSVRKKSSGKMASKKRMSTKRVSKKKSKTRRTQRSTIKKGAKRKRTRGMRGGAEEAGGVTFQEDGWTGALKIDDIFELAGRSRIGPDMLMGLIGSLIHNPASANCKNEKFEESDCVLGDKTIPDSIILGQFYGFLRMNKHGKLEFQIRLPDSGEFHFFPIHKVKIPTEGELVIFRENLRSGGWGLRAEIEPGVLACEHIPIQHKEQAIQELIGKVNQQILSSGGISGEISREDRAAIIEGMLEGLDIPQSPRGDDGPAVETMKLGELRERAKAGGLEPEAIEGAIDHADDEGEDPKAAMIKLIAAAEAASAEARLREIADKLEADQAAARALYFRERERSKAVGVEPAAQARQGKGSWYWEDDGGQWWKFHTIHQGELEEAFLAGEPTAFISADHRAGGKHHWRVDFGQMKQTNRDLGTERNVRRVVGGPAA